MCGLNWFSHHGLDCLPLNLASFLQHLQGKIDPALSIKWSTFPGTDREKWKGQKQILFFVSSEASWSILIGLAFMSWNLAELVEIFSQEDMLWTSLAVQWWGVCLPMQGMQIQSLARELRFHMPRSQKTKTWIKQCGKKFSEDYKKREDILFMSLEEENLPMHFATCCWDGHLKDLCFLAKSADWW